jgi:hypothetical protein
MPFTYSLNFTNSTAIASLHVAVPSVGTYILLFTGNRVDTDDGQHDPQESTNSSRTVAVELADPAKHPAGPHFLFTNGSEFFFDQNQAMANLTTNHSTGSTSLAPGWKVTPWMGGGIGIWIASLAFAIGWAFLLC